MTLPTWPSAINTWAMLGSWQVGQLDNAPLSSDMNAGTTRFRRKYTLRISNVSFEMVMTVAELTAFKTFFNDTLSAGTSRFTMNIWDGGVYVERTVRFRQGPKFTEFAFLKTRVTIDLTVESL